MTTLIHLTQELVRKHFDYNPKTGELIRKISSGGQIVGAVAGSVNKRKGYCYVRLFYKLYMAHRLIWLYQTGELPKGEIDHINGIRSDNRIANLREVTHQENAQNMRLRGNNTSGFCGVCFNKAAQKWTARIKIDNEYIQLGVFADKSDAIRARQAANRKYGFHPNHGMKKE